MAGFWSFWQLNLNCIWKRENASGKTPATAGLRVEAGWRQKKANDDKIMILDEILGFHVQCYPVLSEESD